MWPYRRYRVWVINTSTAASLYKWENWKLLMPSIGNLLQLTSAQAHIRTFQGFEHENKWLAFGRMKWDDENNKKWTTKYRNETNAVNLNFFGTEIWAPDWNKFNDTGIPPDIYIKLYNYVQKESIKEGVIIAIPRRLAVKHNSAIELELRTLMTLIPDSAMAMTTRSWWAGWKFPNQIADMNYQELKKIIGK